MALPLTRSGSFRHMRGCAPDWRTATWEDVTWTEFQGTFYEGDESVTGVNVTASCMCGQYTNRVWRYQGSYAELLTKITDLGRKEERHE